MTLLRMRIAARCSDNRNTLCTDPAIWALHALELCLFMRQTCCTTTQSVVAYAHLIPRPMDEGRNGIKKQTLITPTDNCRNKLTSSSGISRSLRGQTVSLQECPRQQCSGALPALSNTVASVFSLNVRSEAGATVSSPNVANVAGIPELGAVVTASSML